MQWRSPPGTDGPPSPSPAGGCSPQQEGCRRGRRWSRCRRCDGSHRTAAPEGPRRRPTPHRDRPWWRRGAPRAGSSASSPAPVAPGGRRDPCWAGNSAGRALPCSGSRPPVRHPAHWSRRTGGTPLAGRAVAHRFRVVGLTAVGAPLPGSRARHGLAIGRVVRRPHPDHGRGGNRDRRARAAVDHVGGTTRQRRGAGMGRPRADRPWRIHSRRLRGQRDGAHRLRPYALGTRWVKVQTLQVPLAYGSSG